jgi:ketosteroid isomerase-like protein
VLSAFFLGGCANMPSSSQSPDEAAIRLARLTQTQAIAKGDLDVVVSYWTPDVTMRRAMGQPVEGAAAPEEAAEQPTKPSSSSS